MEGDEELSPEMRQMASMMETMAAQMFQAVAPVLRQNVRAVLERNDKLVNQDQTALEFLTEEIVNAILRPVI
jgi:hypothetical protein